mgnify:FL=1
MSSDEILVKFLIKKGKSKNRRFIAVYLFEKYVLLIKKRKQRHDE